MQAILILILAGLTSLSAYFIGTRRLRLSSRCCREAIGKMLESVGTILVFLALNLVMAVTIVLAVRSLTRTFVSIYIIDDVAWVGLSLIQGLTFQWWRESSRNETHG